MTTSFPKSYWRILSIQAGQKEQPFESGLWEVHGHFTEDEGAARIWAREVAARFSSIGRQVLLVGHSGSPCDWHTKVLFPVRQA